MSLPQLLARILIQGTSIVGKAFAEAGRQAVRNARAVPAESAAAAGSSSSSSNPAADQLTRTHRMTVEEARMILNVKPQEGESLQDFQARLQKSYDHLYAVNAPPAPKGKQGGGSGSFYMQSKVVRAKQRIEAEWAQGEGEGGAGATKESPGEQAQQQQQPPKDGSP